SPSRLHRGRSITPVAYRISWLTRPPHATWPSCPHSSATQSRSCYGAGACDTTTPPAPSAPSLPTQPDHASPVVLPETGQLSPDALRYGSTSSMIPYSRACSAVRIL